MKMGRGLSYCRKILMLFTSYLPLLPKPLAPPKRRRLRSTFCHAISRRTLRVLATSIRSRAIIRKFVCMELS